MCCHQTVNSDRSCIDILIESPKSTKVDMAGTKWPDIVFSGDASRATLAAAAKRGRLVRLAAGIYTGRPASQPADVVRRNWFQILDHELPGALITDRCGQRWMPDHDVLTVVHPRQRPLRLPGLTILPRKGLGPLPGDFQRSSIWSASEPRALLENVGRDGSRYLSDLEIEKWLSDLLSVGGDARLNQLRDAARSLAETADEERSFERLDAMIGAALMTRPADTLRSAALRAYSQGQPFDHRRIEAFEALATRLASIQPAPLPQFVEDEPRRKLLPFYEAHFSNFIEGTEFSLEQAAAIVFDNDIPADRPRDAHDILGTYQIVGDSVEMEVTPSTSDQLVQVLRDRHGRMLAARPDVRPGLFKEKANQAGSTLFVDPALVEPTIRQGFEVGRALLGPFARAVYLMFLVSECIPLTTAMEESRGS